ncbi:cobalt-precorrin-5B (C(1))-methyltransferase [Larsenimonas rhizosphaerae]|uniref:cobalt-precorrin-5B (C(1))-methyltransferase n=1 Tax=Larsenimonas rhizosphaerae TaxID=2944682 RepID=UPI002033CB5C|nr:cobalt-precorrin-5B (C(1))-methyltransferase [Larsenimonas rhizosphaerae]MCM2130483.1 cobalt-precorrin-5B (C(1))-methyltransferase [Larsenimonas rhizosphaerae]
MWPESDESARPLRSGLTTGSCATACALAAARFLLTGQRTEQCDIDLPSRRGQPGKRVSLPITALSCPRAGQARADTIKDAGDDPDVTHGATVFAVITCSPGPGVFFHAERGVGIVQRDGLPVPVGEPAINPVPRRMLEEHLTALASELNYRGGFHVGIGVEQGETLALKTMNPRLGITGGLSILGTTGIVRPFSCAAYIASIHQAIDVAHANHLSHIAATTGNMSERYARTALGLDDMALIEMGDFAGAVLKHLKRVPMARLSLVGGIGKISKLADGHLDLHSRASSINFEFMRACAEAAGASEAVQQAILAANTTGEALARASDIPLATMLCHRAWQQAHRRLPAGTVLDVTAVDRQGQPLGRWPSEAS